MKAGAVIMVLCCVAAQLSAQTESFRYNAVRRVTIQDVAVTDVAVVADSTDSVGGEFSGFADGQSIAHRLRGEELLITGTFSRLDSLGRERPRLALTVPQGTELRVETSSGSVRVEGVDGGKWIETGAGTIAVIGGSGNIQATSGRGDQRFDGVRGEIRAKAQAGRIEVNNHEGSLLLETEIGSITGRGIKAVNDCTFKAGVGGIDVDFTNPASELTYALKSITGRIEVDGRTERGTVQIGNGPIRITGATTAGRQRYQ